MFNREGRQMKKYKKIFKFQIEESEFETLREGMEIAVKAKDNYNRRQTVNVLAKLNDIAEGESEYDRIYR